MSILTWAEGEKTCKLDQRNSAHWEMLGVGRGARVGAGTITGMVGVGVGGRMTAASTHPEVSLTKPGVGVALGDGVAEGDDVGSGGVGVGGVGSPIANGKDSRSA